MPDLKHKLMIEQLDKKIAELNNVKIPVTPPGGWIRAIRKSINMTLKQFASRLKKTPSSVSELEQREANKSITLQKLVEMGEALDLHFFYGFIPKEGSLEKMVEKKAEALAAEIVMRTSHSMKLEAQEVTPERLKRAINDRKKQIMENMPKNVWN